MCSSPVVLLQTGDFQQKKMKKKYLLKTPSQPTFQHLEYSALLNRSSQADPQPRTTHLRPSRPMPHRLKTEPPPCQPPQLTHSKPQPSSSNIRKARYLFGSSSKENKNSHSYSSKKSSKNRMTYNQYRVSQFLDFERSFKMDATLFNNRLSESKHQVQQSLQKHHKNKYCLNQHKKEKGQKQDSFEVTLNRTKHLNMYLQKEEKKVRAKQGGAVPESLKADDVVIEEQIGSGTFGKVYNGRVRSSGAKVAIKKVQQQKKYKTRQLQMVKMLQSPFVVKVYSTFSTEEGRNDFLNIVMESFSSNFFDIIKKERPLDPLDLKCYAYQMIRGIMYLHSQGVCHRDLKPQNMLVKDKRLVLCDFGSAKILRPGEQNISYICSRCYRAPELIFQSTQYSTQIDMWSLGCIFLQVMHGRPLFIADSSLNHILEVIKVMGTPSKQQVTAMNPHYEVNDYDLPTIPPKSLKKLFPNADLLFLDLTQQLVRYNPQKRLTAPQALAHAYFDQLRQQRTFRGLSSRRNIDYFFNFENEPLPLTLKDKLIPKWYPLH